MSLTSLHKPARRPRAPEDAAREFAHYQAMQFVEKHEAALLKKVFRAFHIRGTPLDLNKAARIVAEFDAESGASFHERLFEVCFALDRPGWLFHWKRRDLAEYTPKL